MKIIHAKTHKEVLKSLLKDQRFRVGYEDELKKLRIAQRLIALRESRHLTQAQLAKRIGASQPFIAKVESGQVHNFNLETLAKIASALQSELEIRFKSRLAHAA